MSSWKKAVREVTKVVKDVVTAPNKWAQKATNWVYDKWASPFVKKVLGDNFDNLFRGALNFGYNIANAADNAFFDMGEGALTGDWDKFKQGATTALKLGVAAVATIAAIVSFQWYALPFIAIYLDHNFNGGAITAASIGITGDFEKAVLGTNVVERNAEWIYMGLVVGSTIVTNYMAGSYMSDITAGTNYQFFFDIATYAGAGAAAYGGYQMITDAKERYEKGFKEWQERYKQAQQINAQLNKEFENIHLGLDPYTYYAGGKIYNSFAPTENNFNPLLVNEPYSQILRFYQKDKQRWQEINEALEYRQLNTAAGTAYFEQRTFGEPFKSSPFERLGTIGKNYI